MSIGNKFNLTRFFRKSSGEVVDDTQSTLQQVAAFSELKGGVIEHLAEVMHFRDYRAKEFLYHEDDPALGLYIVQKGSVRLSKLDPDGDSHELRCVESNDMFGEGSLIGNLRRYETAQVLTDSRLLGLFKPDLVSLLRRFPNSGTDILLALSDRFVSRQEGLWKLLSEMDGGIDLVKQSYELETIYQKNKN